MERTVSIAKQVTALAGEEGFTDLMEITKGQTLFVKRVTFDFPTDARGYVYISVWKGNIQVVPTEGEITTYWGHLTLEVNQNWESGTRLRVKWRNTDNTADHKVLVIVEGEYKDQG